MDHGLTSRCSGTRRHTPGSYADLIDFVLHKLTEAVRAFHVSVFAGAVQLLRDQFGDVFPTVFQQHILCLILQQKEKLCLILQQKEHKKKQRTNLDSCVRCDRRTLVVFERRVLGWSKVRGQETGRSGVEHLILRGPGSKSSWRQVVQGQGL